MRRSTCSVCFVALLAGLCVAPAAARDNELSLTLGYTHLSLDAELEFLDITEITSLDDTGGIYGGIRFSRSIFVEQLRLGSGVQVARYSTDGRAVPGLFEIERERFLEIAPELQLSWRQRIGERFFIEPGIGGGIVIGNYRARGVTLAGLPQDDVNEWQVGYGVRPFVRIGWELERVVVGLEASHRWTRIEYDEIDASTREWMAGAFVSFRF
jgi:hypothetical protein